MSTQPLSVHPWGVSRDGWPGSALAGCLEAAIAAPSVHNSQPWLFRLGTDRIDVLADFSRGLPWLDPRSRELIISVGAAILNLRVAVLRHGRLPLLRLLPSPGQPELMARLTLDRQARPDETVRSLAAAIPRRHTNRRPFADSPVPDDTMRELVGAAAAEGAAFAPAHPVTRDAILSLVRTADHWQRAAAGYRDELSTWTVPVPGRQDGVPHSAFGPRDVSDALPLRDFGLTQMQVTRRLASFEAHPVLAVVSTYGDQRRHWLRAGMAMERVLLTATVRGLATTPMTQPLELPRLRPLLCDPDEGRVAQVILRLGYGRPAAGSPRRPLAEFLI